MAGGLEILRIMYQKFIINQDGVLKVVKIYLCVMDF